ncbi:hypothetical protein [Aquibacillus saliphilus]|uniref:hypothetical protein n=1 Tax=Aquibacillus saliphilus TaxID=1909422 RepID=UPI001CF078AC|nr:hypothetical protein [Aquibacillus saliphilus]
MIGTTWLFVLASTIAVLGILFSYKNLITIIQHRKEHEKLTTEAFQKLQSTFFIRIALIEAFPILLIIFGFVQMENNPIVTADAIFPLLIIMALLSYALINVVITRSDAITDSATTEYKNFVNTLTIIGFATITGIPAISIISMFLF